MAQITTTLINGQSSNFVSVDNRALQFGDGLFETCVIKDGHLLFWRLHFLRLQEGGVRLGLPEIKESIWLNDIQKLVNKSRLKNAIIKLIVTRGDTKQGYKTNHITKLNPTRISRIMPLPKIKNQALSLDLCQSHYGHNPQLAGIKHCNRLDNILAANTIVDPIDDCIMLDEQQHIISTTRANIFIIKEGVLITPELKFCGITGTRRSTILKLAPLVNLSISFKPITLVQLEQADEVFISNSVLGLAWVARFKDIQYVQGCYAHSLKALLIHTETESSHIIKPKPPYGSILKWGLLIAVLGFLVFYGVK